jgi:FtsP/CotA-like multicopper oxidase with cupredoxin domain
VCVCVCVCVLIYISGDGLHFLSLVLIACRHGINQVMTNWADGVVGITQCALQNGESYTYEFTLIDQVGTFFWHAHVSWLRGTLYGAFIVHPKTPAPYPKPTATYPILFGNALSRIY